MPDPNVPEDVNTVPAEDGTTWVEIASTGTADEAKLLAGFLDSEGIAAQIENVAFSMAPADFGQLGDIRVYVSAQDETRAQELLRNRQAEFEQLDDDTETLVTEDGATDVDTNTQPEPETES